MGLKHLCVAAALALSPGVAGAAVIDWTAALAPGNEVPPVVAPGASGSAFGTVDTLTGALTWTVEWSGLTGAAVGLHFHGPAMPDQNAGVQVNIGTISGFASPSSGGTTITPTQVTALLDELWYINVHTAKNPGGEIRGQVIASPVPVPAGLPLVLSGLAVLGVLRRRAAG